MLNHSRTRIRESTQRDVASGSKIVEEGLALIIVADGGEAKIKASAGAGGEVFAGFSLTHVIAPTDIPLIVEVTAVGTTLTLPKTPISGQLRIVGVVSGTDLTVQAGAPANSGEAQWTAGTSVTLNAAQSGLTFIVHLRYLATVEEAVRETGDGMPGRLSQQSIQGRCSVITEGDVVTSNFSTLTPYTAGGAVKLGANGIITGPAGAGVTIPGWVVKKLPSAGNNWLELTSVP